MRRTRGDTQYQQPTPLRVLSAVVVAYAIFAGAALAAVSHWGRDLRQADDTSNRLFALAAGVLIAAGAGYLGACLGGRSPLRVGAILAIVIVSGLAVVAQHEGIGRGATERPAWYLLIGAPWLLTNQAPGAIVLLPLAAVLGA